MFFLSKNKTLILNFLYVFDNWGTGLSHKKMQYTYSKKMFTGRVKPIRIISDPDNQRPDNWRSTVIGFLIRKWEEEKRCRDFLRLNALRE